MFLPLFALLLVLFTFHPKSNVSGQANYQQIGNTYKLPESSEYSTVAISKDSNTIIFFDYFNLLGYVYQRNLQSEVAIYEQASTFQTVDGVPGFDVNILNHNLALSYDAGIIIWLYHTMLES